MYFTTPYQILIKGQIELWKLDLINVIEISFLFYTVNFKRQ